LLIPKAILPQPDGPPSSAAEIRAGIPSVSNYGNCGADWSVSAGAGGDSPVCPPELSGNPDTLLLQLESWEHPQNTVVELKTIRPKTILRAVFIDLRGNSRHPKLFSRILAK